MYSFSRIIPTLISRTHTQARHIYPQCDGIFNVAAVIGQLFSTMLGPAYIPLLSHSRQNLSVTQTELSPYIYEMEGKQKQEVK